MLMNNEVPILLIEGASATCLAVVALAAIILGSVCRNRATTAPAWEFEAQRRIALAKGSATFRWFEPFIDELAEFHKRRASARLEKIRKELVCAAEPLPWKPEEYLAGKEIEGAIARFTIAMSLGFLYGGLVVGLIAAIAILALTVRLSLSSLAERATKRSQTIKARLPFAIDLIALMLEAGAGLLESLNTLVRELRGHPLGDEFALVVNEVGVGRSIQSSLNRFQQRVPNDEDIAELVFMINKGDEFGTPMATTVRLQADRMRLKRSQWAEKAAGAAQVAIVFPGMLIMIACLLIIAAPFVLSALYL